MKIHFAKVCVEAATINLDFVLKQWRDKRATTRAIQTVLGASLKSTPCGISHRLHQNMVSKCKPQSEKRKLNHFITWKFQFQTANYTRLEYRFSERACSSFDMHEFEYC